MQQLQAQATRLGSRSARPVFCSPTQAPRHARRQLVTAIATPPVRQQNSQQKQQVDLLGRAISLSDSTDRQASSLSASTSGTPAAETLGKATKREVVLEDFDEGLTSTWKHRFFVWGATGLLGALIAQGASEVHELRGAATAVAAILAAYVTSDFATGVYHWGVDNYGSRATPIVGSQIAAFQGHHQRPWTITEREFCNNVHKVFKPALPFAAACLAVSPWTSGVLDIFLGSFVFLVCMSQQFHAWAHSKKSELPEAVVALQDAGLLISRRAHGAHHKAPFEGNYCIVSGFWNPILDAGGSDQGFFRRMECFFQERTGVEPRCWREPLYEYEEEKPSD